MAEVSLGWVYTCYCTESNFSYFKNLNSLKITVGHKVGISRIIQHFILLTTRGLNHRDLITDVTHFQTKEVSFST
jgi:hypothetical protein